MITREEERELIVRAQAGDNEALGELLEAHRRFMYREARRTGATREEDIEDLVQEAAIAAMESIKDFDVDSGNRFLTFAGRKVGWRVKRASDESGLIRVPSITWNSNHGTDENRELAKRVSRLTSIDVPAGDDEKCSLGALIGAESSVVSDLSREEEVDLLREAIDGLPERMGEVVRRRLAGDILEEIAADMGVTRERVRQIEAKAHGLLRQRLAFIERNEPPENCIETRWPEAEAARARTLTSLLFGEKPRFSRWSPVEMAYVESKFDQMKLVDIAREIRRPYGSLIVACRTLNLKKPRFIWTPERDQKLLDLSLCDDYGQWQRAAAALGCTQSAVHNRVRRLGIQRQKKLQTRRDEIARLHATGMSLKAMSMELGVCGETVRVALRELGLKTNPRDLSLVREWARSRRGSASPGHIAAKRRAAELGHPDETFPMALVTAAMERIGTGTIHDIVRTCVEINRERGWNRGASHVTVRMAAKKLVDSGRLRRVSGGGRNAFVYALASTLPNG